MTNSSDRSCFATLSSLYAIAQNDRARGEHTRNEAQLRAVRKRVMPVDSLLAIKGDRDRLLSALTNLLQNAFKFTQPKTEVVLNAYAAADHICIEVRDHCGGLSAEPLKPCSRPSRSAAPIGADLGLGLGRPSPGATSKPTWARSR